MAYLTIDNYKIGQFVHPQYDDIVSDLFRYDIHVRQEFKTLLTSTITRDAKHRPVKKKYYIDDIKVMEKYWTFTDQDETSGLMKTRKVEVAHVLNDGTMGDRFTLKYDSYDLTNPDDLSDVLNERSGSRRYTMSVLKGQVLGVLQLLHPSESQEDIEDWGASFFSTHNAAISAYYEANNNMLIAAVSADTTHTWLDDVVQPGLTIRLMVIGAVS